LDKWVDIVFGKKQLPKNPIEAAKSCNIFAKYTYEQNINLEEKLKKYKDRCNGNELEEKKLCAKLQNKINMIYNFGVCPIQILTETNSYEGNPNLKTNIMLNWTKEGNYIYFTKIKNNYYLSIKEFQNNKDIIPIRNINIYEYQAKKEKYVFSSEYFEDDIPKIFMNNNSYSVPLYKINYSISHIVFIDEFQNKQIFILTCRFLGNIFRVQNSEKIIMVSCEDFVTSIIARNSKENDTIFYTGLKNGKLTEWKIQIIQKLNEKKQKYEFSSFLIKEKKHIYAHKSAITAIEINNSKQIIATSGEDKFIRIRKLYDFEILTSIDLTYSFGNSVISENTNIFPSLIKISDLNCIYVLLYDYKSNITRIRGYTLNGLFFAQTDVQNLIYTNISFNKNWNIIAGVYNYNAVILLNSFNLKVLYQRRFLEENKTNKHLTIKWLEYVPTSKEFIILYDDECQIMTLKDEEQKIFDY
jgi:WD40 repeat protein